MHAAQPKTSSDLPRTYAVGRVASPLPQTVAGLQALHAEWLTEEAARRHGHSDLVLTADVLIDQMKIRLPGLILESGVEVQTMTIGHLTHLADVLAESPLFADPSIFPVPPEDLASIVDEVLFPYLFALQDMGGNVSGMEAFVLKYLNRGERLATSAVDDRGRLRITTQAIRIWNADHPSFYRLVGEGDDLALEEADGDTGQLVRSIPMTPQMVLAVWHLAEEYLARRESGPDATV